MSTENSGNNRGNVNNLTPHQFKPGESGNPGGRPKKLPITDYITEQLDKPISAAMRAKLPPTFTDVFGERATYGQVLAFNMIESAAKGNMRSMTIIFDRVEGKVSQKLSLSGSDSSPVEFTVRRVGIDL